MPFFSKDTNKKSSKIYDGAKEHQNNLIKFDRLNQRLDLEQIARFLTSHLEVA